MPCMGPSKDHAYKLGEQAFQEVYDLLIKKYHIADADMKIPTHLENGKPVNGPVFGFPSKEARQLKKQLKELVQEILWQDACDGF